MILAGIPLLYSQSQTFSIENSLLIAAEDFYNEAKYDSAIYYLEKAVTQIDSEANLQEFLQCLNLLGDSYYQIDEIEKAEQTLNRSLNIVKPIHKQETATACHNLGKVYIEKGEYRQAADLLNSALEIRGLLLGKNHSTTASTFLQLGKVYNYLGEYKQAVESYTNYLNVMRQTYGEENEQVAIGYYNIGIVYDIKGNYDRALDLYQKSLDIRLKIHGKDHLKIASNYNGIAIVHHYKGDDDLAIQYFKRSLDIRLKSLGETHQLVAESYNNLGLIYMNMEQYEQAQNMIQKALTIRENIFDREHPLIARSQNNLGIIFLRTKEYEKALHLFNMSLKNRIRKLGENHPLVASCIFNIAMIKDEQGYYDEAVKLFLKSADIRSHSLNKHHEFIADTYCQIGEIYLKQTNVDSALFYYQQALFILAPGFKDSSFYANPAPDSAISQVVLLNVLLNKANALIQRSTLRDQMQNREAAHEIYIALANLVKHMRQGFPSEAAKLSLNKEAGRIYWRAVANAFDLYKLTGKSFYLKRAFGFVEGTKANVLHEAILESQAKQFGDIPDSLLQQEKLLKMDITFYDTELQQQMRNQTDSEKISTLENKIFSLKQEYYNLTAELEQGFPDYYKLKHKDTELTIEELQNILDNQSIILEYFISDTSLYILSLSKSDFNIESVKLDAPVAEAVKQFRQSLQNLDFDNYLASASSLYNILIKPVEKVIASAKNLSIIPDGILYYLPFEALLSENINTIDGLKFSELPYLLKKYNINYMFSSSFLRRKNEVLKPQYGFAGFAPVFKNDSETNSKIISVIDTSITISSTRAVNIKGENYSSLPETENEVMRISELFNSKKLSSKIFLHSLAKEDFIKSDSMKNFGIIHIASHGFINEKKPKLSGILFWNDIDDTTEEDGILYSGEIYNLDLKADLVVLSACETGLGKIVRGEGIIGLTRGFIYAGAKNIVVSLWQVADKSTSELMIEFYKNVLNGKSYSSALREAKLKLINEGTYSYPLEWSPFVLIGK